MPNQTRLLTDAVTGSYRSAAKVKLNGFLLTRRVSQELLLKLGSRKGTAV